MSEYDNNKDYVFPYHWSIKEHDFYDSGVMYFGYLKIISEQMAKLGCQGKKHLDVGCGDGRATSFFCSNNQLESKGIDISSRAIAFAKLMGEHPKIEFSNENLFDLSEKYDLVTAVEVLEHIDKEMLPDFIRKISQLVNSNGYFICSVPSWNIPTSLHSGHVQHFDAQTLQALLSQGSFSKTNIIYQHNMKYSFFQNKNPLFRGFYSLLRNKYYTINAVERKLAKLYYRFCNVCNSEQDAGRLICIAQRA